MLQPLQLVLGRSGAMVRALQKAAQFARSCYPILLLGKPGTGKTVLARHIHRESRRSGEFIAESAANIPEHMEHAHLAGHVRGAFTGAVDHQMGLVESAHRGTFFLDELGVATPKVQEILLQLLDQGTLRRVGETRPRPVLVRFIAATNADLEQMAVERRFRRDLLDRFGFLKIQLPSLAERRDDILPLADHFLQQEAAQRGFHERPVLSDQVRDCFLAAPWHGNIRELESVCRYAVLTMDADRPITLADLPEEFLAGLGEIARARRVAEGAAAGRIERLQEAIAAADGKVTEAARKLGMSRQQIYRIFEKEGVKLERPARGGGQA